MRGCLRRSGEGKKPKGTWAQARAGERSAPSLARRSVSRETRRRASFTAVESARTYTYELPVRGLGWGATRATQERNRAQGFLSVDPLAGMFPGHSAYTFALNSPTNLVDRDGRAPSRPLHDYFDSNGNFIGSDNRGDEIRVVNSEVIKGTVNLPYTDRMTVYAENSTLAGEMVYAENTAGALAGIVSFYRNKLVDCSSPEVVTSKDRNAGLGLGNRTGRAKFVETPQYGAPAGALIYTGKPVIVVGITNAGTVRVPEVKRDLNNRYDLMNSVLHEIGHYNRITKLGDSHYYGEPVEAAGAGDVGINNHLEVYLEGIEHWTFKQSTPGHQSQIRAAFHGYIKQLKNEQAKEAWEQVEAEHFGPNSGDGSGER